MSTVLLVMSLILLFAFTKVAWKLVKVTSFLLVLPIIVMVFITYGAVLLYALGFAGH